MSRRHHLVPQFYLRNFANHRDQVVLVDRRDLRSVFTSSVRKACAEVDFYRFAPGFAEGDGDPEAVENLLSGFEHAAAPAVRKLIDTGLSQVTTSDWYHLINHIAIQTVRGHRWREDFNSLATHQMRLHLRETLTDERIEGWLKGRGEPADPAHVDDFRRRVLGASGPRLAASQELLIQQGMLLALGGIGERLADGMDWTVVVADQACALTSDEPVVWWSPGEGPVGYGSAQVVWLPLSPTRLLQLQSKSMTPQAMGLPPTSTPEGRDELFRFVNARVASQAHRWVVHHPGQSPLDGLKLDPLTAWQDELVAVEDDGSIRRESWRHRRLPLQEPDGAG